MALINQDPNSTSNGNPTGQPNLPYFLQGDPIIPIAPPPNSKKKWILLGGGILLLLLVGLALVIALSSKQQSGNATTKAQTLVLTTKKIDGVQFVYPTSWKTLDASGLGFTLGYGTATTPASSTTAIYYKKSVLFPTAQKVSEVTSATKTAIQNSIVGAIGEKNTTAHGCTGFKLLGQTKLDTAAYFGVDVYWSCAKNSARVPIRELDRYLYVGDGNLYQVAISGVEIAWQDSSLLTLQNLNKQIVPKQ